MKTRIFATGSNISTRAWNPRTKTGSFADKDLIDTLLSQNTKPQYFLTKEAAKEHVWIACIPDNDCYGIIACPVIFEVAITFNACQNWQVSGLLTGSVYVTTETCITNQLNFSLSLQHKPGMFDALIPDLVLDYLNPKIAPLIVTQENFPDISKLNLSVIKPSLHMFLFGNSQRFTPAGQPNSYQLPNEITQHIGEYVVGAKLGK